MDAITDTHADSAHPLAEWRRRNDVSAELLAERLHCSPAAVRSWEARRRYPRPHTIRRIESETRGSVTAKALHDAFFADRFERQEAGDAGSAA